jgi:hypothetical protein
MFWLLFISGWMAFFGWQLIATLHELNQVEEERDALWDELHGISR